MNARPLCAGLFAGALALALPSLARAQGADGVYGRLSRDAVFSGDLHGGVLLGTLRGPSPEPPPAGGIAAPAVALTLRARALDMSGVFVGYHFAFAGAERRDALSVGVDFRPFYFGRLFSDLEHGPRALDLFIDSIGLDLGVSWWRPGAQGSGFAFVLGTGAELPLVWSDETAQGLTVRLGVTWHHAIAGDVLGPGGDGNALLVTLGLVGRLTARANLIPHR